MGFGLSVGEGGQPFDRGLRLLPGGHVVHGQHARAVCPSKIDRIGADFHPQAGFVFIAGNEA